MGNLYTSTGTNVSFSGARLKALKVTVLAHSARVSRKLNSLSPLLLRALRDEVVLALAKRAPHLRLLTLPLCPVHRSQRALAVEVPRSSAFEASVVRLAGLVQLPLHLGGHTRA